MNTNHYKEECKIAINLKTEDWKTKGKVRTLESKVGHDREQVDWLGRMA